METLTLAKGVKLLVKMISKCMLCQVVYREQVVELADPNMNITHGYCPSCFEELMNDDMPLMSNKEKDENVP